MYIRQKQSTQCLPAENTDNANLQGLKKGQILKGKTPHLRNQPKECHVVAKNSSFVQIRENSDRDRHVTNGLPTPGLTRDSYTQTYSTTRVTGLQGNSIIQERKEKDRTLQEEIVNEYRRGIKSSVKGHEKYTRSKQDLNLGKGCYNYPKRDRPATVRKIRHVFPGDTLSLLPKKSQTARLNKKRASTSGLSYIDIANKPINGEPILHTTIHTWGRNNSKLSKKTVHKISNSIPFLPAIAENGQRSQTVGQHTGTILLVTKKPLLTKDRLCRHDMYEGNDRKMGDAQQNQLFIGSKNDTFTKTKLKIDVDCVRQTSSRKIVKQAINMSFGKVTFEVIDKIFSKFNFPKDNIKHIDTSVDFQEDAYSNNTTVSTSPCRESGLSGKSMDNKYIRYNTKPNNMTCQDSHDVDDTMNNGINTTFREIPKHEVLKWLSVDNDYIFTKHSSLHNVSRDSKSTKVQSSIRENDDQSSNGWSKGVPADKSDHTTKTLTLPRRSITVETYNMAFPVQSRENAWPQLWY